MKLISAKSIVDAYRIAREYDIHPLDVVYVPLLDDEGRRRALFGHRVKEEDLIGYFTDEERRMVITPKEVGK